MNLLSISGLHVDFVAGQAAHPAVNGVDLAIAEGDMLALVGESGSGKSVTATAILGLLPRRSTRVRGSITWSGRELVGASESALNRIRGVDIGMVFQNALSNQDPCFTIGRQLLRTAALHRGRTDGAIAQVVERQLARVGIRDPDRVMRAYPHQLSGGMRQRVMIAAATINSPRLLIADEPTTALDATTQKQILDLLLEINRDAGTAVMIITHDFGVVSYLSRHVAVMRAGRIVDRGPTHAVLRSMQPYTRELLDSVPSLRQGKAPAARHRIAHAAPVLRARGVSKAFRRPGHTAHLQALLDIDLTLHRGESLGIIGESGSGKSTLARTLARLLEPDTGTIALDAATDARPPERLLAFRRRVQIVFQDAGSAFNPRRTIGDQIAAPLGWLGLQADGRERRRRVRESLERVGLPAGFADRLPHQLSGGQRQRAGIARALAVNPEILILDEPTSALDASVQRQIVELLNRIRAQSAVSFIVIGHGLPVMTQLCDRIAVMDRGRIVEIIDGGDLLASGHYPATMRLIEALLPLELARASAA